MRALVVDHSVPGRLALATVPDPVPGPDEVLVRVSAISLNHGELPKADDAPAGVVPGWDAAGVVERAAASGRGPKAVVVGAVTVAGGVSIWYGAVLRGDSGPITVGADTNVQDNCTLHADPGFALVLGERISVGHNAVLHGCTVEDDVLVGMGATVLNGALVGAGSLVAAGAVVPQGMVVPPRSLVAGVPAKVRRELTEDERAGIRANGAGYRLLAEAHRGIEPLG